MMTRRKAILDEEVSVVSVDGLAGTATKLREVDGERRWIVKGDPIEDWWVEIDVDGRELPGDWEYAQTKATWSVPSADRRYVEGR